MFKPLRLSVAFVLGVAVLPLIGASVAAASAPPRCIVSLSPTATETLFAIGAGSQVQAVDKDSNYPVSGLPSKRIDSLNPSVEAVLGICKTSVGHPSAKPDLVIDSYDANSIQEKLTALGIKVVDQDAPTTLSGAYRQIEQLGTLTGHSAAASALVASLRSTISKDVASIPSHPKKKVTVYYEIGTNPYYSLTSQTFVGSLMKALGLVNIADADATTADAGYPQLSSEYIVSADPAVIFTADDVSAASVAKRPGFANVNAVRHEHVVELNADIASRWGPRLGQLMNQLTKEVKVVLNDTALWH